MKTRTIIVFLLALFSASCAPVANLASTETPTPTSTLVPVPPTTTAKANPTEMPIPTSTSTPAPPTTTATPAPTRVFVPETGAPYNIWGWPSQAITVWVGNQELNKCDSGRVWYCDPHWNPNMKIYPPDLRVFNDSWRFGGKVSAVSTENMTYTLMFDAPATDVVLNTSGKILIDSIIGILPTGEEVPMGYALKNGGLVPTSMFMDSSSLNVDWLLKYESEGGYPGANPCGFVGLQPDGNYTLMTTSSIVFRMLHPRKPNDGYTMGVNAYHLAGIKLVAKQHAGGPYQTCTK
jgi:hypothetical protein